MRSGVTKTRFCTLGRKNGNKFSGKQQTIPDAWMWKALTDLDDKGLYEGRKWMGWRRVSMMQGGVGCWGENGVSKKSIGRGIFWKDDGHDSMHYKYAYDSFFHNK
jgi:hypothetical protein